MMKASLTRKHYAAFIGYHCSVNIQFFKFSQSCCKNKETHDNEIFLLAQPQQRVSLYTSVLQN